MSQAATIHALHEERLLLDDGASAAVKDGALELRDAEGRLIVHYRDGTATVLAPRDLELAAPHGQVRVSAGTDIVFEAARDVTQQAGRSVSVSAADRQRLEMDGQRTHIAASRLDVEARQSRLVSPRAEVVARKISTTAEELAITVTRYELAARKIVETTRDAFRTVLGLEQRRLGRLRTIVSDTMSLRAGRTVIVSKRDTSIDGEHVLLG